MFLRTVPTSLLKTSDPGIFRRIPLSAPGHLFVSPMPYGAYDVRGRVLKNYRRHRVEHVILLVTEDELRKKARVGLLRAYSKAGISTSRHPIRDLQSADVEILDALVSEIGDRLLSGQRVALHCHAGVGRTALAAACVTSRIDGVSGDRAIEHVRGNMQVRMTDEQIALVRQYCTRPAA